MNSSNSIISNITPKQNGMVNYFVIGIIILVLIFFLYMYFTKRATNQTNQMGQPGLSSDGSDRKYNVTFKTMWGNPNVQIGYPKDPHTGTIFVTVHDKNYTPFNVGTLASEGIQQSAEYGMSDKLVEHAKLEGPHVWKYTTMPVLNAPGQTTFQVDANDTYHYFSIVTMIAPSADWFTGISSVDLNNVPLGQDIPLYAYNAGTDLGTEFMTLPKHPLIPHVSISRITNGVLFPNSQEIPFAYINITKV